MDKGLSVIRIQGFNIRIDKPVIMPESDPLFAESITANCLSKFMILSYTRYDSVILFISVLKILITSAELTFFSAGNNFIFNEL